MVFSSPVFLYLFLPIVVTAYFVAPRRAQNGLLLAASLVFYAWGEAAYVVLMLASAGANYLAGLAIDRFSAGSSGRRLALAVGVGFNLLTLSYFKYWGFLVGTVYSWFEVGAPPPEVRLPLGISFFTFQAISYLVDVYRGEARAQRNPFNVALYIALFPQLIAGPIVRYGSIENALRERRSTLDGVTVGTELFIRGLAKKMLLANPIGQVADAVFVSAPAGLPMGTAWLGAVAYALQIYFDFSGYTDMARGLGRVFGFEFPENFRLPYTATSLRDFWRRWHISLSTWFRDYLYIPLGGSRCGKARTYLNLWVVFVLCGLWHGAAWGFVLWGVFHGVWLVWERSRFGRWMERAPRALGWAITAVFLLFSWVLFRAESLTVATGYWLAMVDARTLGEASPVEVVAAVDGRFWLALGVAIFFALGGGRLLVRWAVEPRWGGRWAPAGAFLARYAVVCGALALSLLQMAAERFNPFIYFRF